MLRTLYSGPFSIVDIIFRSQLTLPPPPPLRPITDLSIADTSNIRHFLQEICIYFTLDNVLHFCLVFFDICYFTFFVSLMAFSVPWKCRDCKFAGISSPYSFLCLTYFLVATMPKAQWDRDRNMHKIMEISVAHEEPLLLYSENQHEPKKQHSCPLCWLALSRVTNTRQPVAFKLLYKHDILWYIVFKLFLLAAPIFWYTLVSITLYPNTLE